VPQGEAIAALRVCAREVANAPEPVDISPRLDRRDADPTNTESAHVERIGVALEPQIAVASTAATDAIALLSMSLTLHQYAA